MKKQYIALLIVGLFLLGFPAVVHSSYYQHLLIITFIWVIIGSSWNLLAGYTGQVSFGHAIFFGIGAYTAGILATKLGISAWWGMLLGGFVSMAIALFVGWVCFRLRGPYFALATLAGGEIFRLIATNWESLTDGMVGILIITTFKSKLPYYYLSLGLAAACIFA
ncbi:MAG: branched-chain amino acid ABC transporter permease, partial [Deltaproteobacteria bacterium]